jgi:hypothetical protein
MIEEKTVWIVVANKEDKNTDHVLNISKKTKYYILLNILKILNYLRSNNELS